MIKDMKIFLYMIKNLYELNLYRDLFHINKDIDFTFKYDNYQLYRNNNFDNQFMNYLCNYEL